MKKTLLSIAAVAAVTLSGMANDYKFVLDGDNDLGGLTRALSTALTDVNLVQSFTLTEDGITLSVKNSAEEVKTGTGLALINAGGTNAGLCAYSGTFGSKVVPEVSITVPNGKITSMKALLSGSAISFATDITLNGTVVNMDNKEGSLFVLEWSDAAGLETVTFSWTNPGFYKQYIHSIEVTYTADLGDKEECGLSFAGKQYEAAMGEDFVAPELSNPNNLPVSWSSSDDKVATVDDYGKVTLVGKGSVAITASTEGNDDFAAGSAKYDITVIPTASNLAQLIEMAPALNDRVKVNFRSTVNYAHLSQAYVTDEEGNAACIDDESAKSSTTAKTVFSIGQIIEAGWIATNSNKFEPVWEGNMKVVADTVADVKYQTVDSITPADANRVVILPQVTFEKQTPDPTQKVFATTANGKTYEFQDTYELAQEPAGVYNVTGVVKYAVRNNIEYFWMAPIAYEPCAVMPDSIGVTTFVEGLEVDQYYDEEDLALYIYVTGEISEDEYSVVLDVPAGWTGFVGGGDGVSIEEYQAQPKKAKAWENDWTPLDYFLSYGYEKGNKFTFKPSSDEQEVYIWLYKDDQVDYNAYVCISAEVTKAETFVAPEYPEMFTMTADPQTLTVAQVPYDEVEWTEEESEWTESAYADQVIEVSGETEKETVSLTFELPEGWAGVAPVKLNLNPDLSGSGDEDLLSTRANESEFAPLDEYLANYSYMPWFDATAVEPGTTLEFPANGEKQIYFCKLYISDEEGVIAGDPEFAGDYVDVANTFIIVVNVSQKESAVEGIDAVNADAVYYNVNGAKVANPAKGIYVKVVDGKATKVVVK